ncbi:hypothetical protein ACHAQI_009076 [Fusarium lateritium]
MHIFVLLSLLPLLGQQVLADTIDEVCGGVDGIIDCKGSFDVPVKAKLKYCPQKLFEIDPCKTKKTFKYPCPTWSDPLKLCDGETCVPGTVEKMVDIPCGIDIITAKRGVCQAVRDSLGNIGNEFIDKSGAMCGCVPKAFGLIKEGILGGLSTVGGVLNIDSVLITEVIRLQKCIIDKKLGVKDDREEVIKTELTPGGGWVVLRAKEIDIATYAEMVAAIGPCLSGICDPTNISYFFKRYLKDTATQFGLQLATMLYEWIKVFEKMKTIVDAIGSSSKTVTTNIASVSSKVKIAQKSACTGKLCVGIGVSGFNKKVANAIATTQALLNMQQAAADSAKNALAMVERTKKVIKVSESIPDSSFFIKLIKSGKLSKLEDIGQAIQLTTELPQAVAQLGGLLSPISELATGYEPLSKKALAAVEEVIAYSWSKYAKELQADSSGNLKKRLVEIQTLFKTQLQKPLKDINTGVSNLQVLTESSPVKPGNFHYDSGIVSYNRWTELSMDVPCMKKARSKFELSGFKTFYDSRQFYSCKFGPQQIPWPDHHIPYIKFRVGSTDS